MKKYTAESFSKFLIYKRFNTKKCRVITQDEIALFCGKSRGWYRKLESGKSHSVENISLVAYFYKQAIQDFFSNYEIYLNSKITLSHEKLDGSN